MRRAASTFAILALIPALGITWGLLASGPETYVETAYPSGLTSDNGTQIGNIFAYDCTGEPLDGVQLFTRDGEPITTLEHGNPPWSYLDDGSSYEYVQNPLATLPNGWDGWNVFPLQQAEFDPMTGELGAATTAEAPSDRVPAVSGDCPVPTDPLPTDRDAVSSGAEGAAQSSAPATGASSGTKVVESP